MDDDSSVAYMHHKYIISTQSSVPLVEDLKMVSMEVFLDCYDAIVNVRLNLAFSKDTFSVWILWLIRTE